MKQCSKCKQEKPFSDFPRDSRYEDGLKTSCKSCAYEASRNWNRSRKGVAVRLWHKHVARSASRGHSAPGYTRDWLINYVLSHPDYERLYQEYEASGWDKYKCPSIDRLDDREGYTKSNIRLVSFQENMDHCYEAGRKAEHDNGGWEKGCMRPHHAVVQLTMSGEYVAEYISVNSATREVPGTDNSKIPMCCQGKRKSHAGYQWMYLEDYLGNGKKAKKVEYKSHGQARPVIQKDLCGNEVARYESASQAARATGFHQTGISKCLLGKIRTHKGYKWEEA